MLHNSRDAKLFDNNSRGKQTGADQFVDSNAAVCQTVCWIALQMAQEEVEWLKEELKRVEQKIEAKEQELLEATKAKALSEVIALFKDQKDRLVNKEKDLWQQLSNLQICLASTSGEVPLQAEANWCNDSRPTTARCPPHTAWCEYSTRVCHPVLRAFIPAVPGASATGCYAACAGLLLDCCWVGST